MPGEGCITVLSSGSHPVSGGPTVVVATAVVVVGGAAVVAGAVVAGGAAVVAGGAAVVAGGAAVVAGGAAVVAWGAAVVAGGAAVDGAESILVREGAVDERLDIDVRLDLRLPKAGEQQEALNVCRGHWRLGSGIVVGSSEERLEGDRRVQGRLRGGDTDLEERDNEGGCARGVRFGVHVVWRVQKG